MDACGHMYEEFLYSCIPGVCIYGSEPLVLFVLTNKGCQCFVSDCNNYYRLKWMA